MICSIGLLALHNLSYSFTISDKTITSTACLVFSLLLLKFTRLSIGPRIQLFTEDVYCHTGKIECIGIVLNSATPNYLAC